MQPHSAMAPWPPAEALDEQVHDLAASIHAEQAMPDLKEAKRVLTAGEKLYATVQKVDASVKAAMEADG